MGAHVSARHFLPDFQSVANNNEQSVFLQKSSLYSISLFYT